MKTFSAKKEDVDHNWYVVDLEEKTLGRVASEIAYILRGKHKPIFTPHVDTGDFVVVVNAEKVVLTGNKLQDKIYRNYSGFIGGMKEATAAELLEKDPRQVILRAVKGMLPKNRLGRQIIKKLKIYTGPDHPHEAQQPQPWQGR